MDFYKRKRKQNHASTNDTLKNEVSTLRNRVNEVKNQINTADVTKMAELLEVKVAEYEKRKENANNLEKENIGSMIEELKKCHAELKKMPRPPVAAPRTFKITNTDDSQISGSSLQGKVEINEIQANLKRMQQKRQNRLSSFESDQHRLAEQRNEQDNGLEIEVAIKAFQKPPQLPRFKSIVQDKIIKRKYGQSMDSIDENCDKDNGRSLSLELNNKPAEETSELNLPLQNIALPKIDLENAPERLIGRSSVNPTTAKSSEQPRTPTQSMRKIFSTFGACAVKETSSDEEDIKYRGQIIENPKIGKQKGMSSENCMLDVKGDLERLKYNKGKHEVVDEKMQQRTLSNSRPESTSIENPLYGMITIDTNAKMLQHLLNNYHSLTAVSDDCEIQRCELDSLLFVVEGTKEFLSKIEKKLREKLNKNRVQTKSDLDELKKTLDDIFMEVKNFKGLKRDVKYLVLTNKLTNLYSEISKLPNDKQLGEDRKNSLEVINSLIRALGSKVERNEHMLRIVLEEQVLLLGLNNLNGTEV